MYKFKKILIIDGSFMLHRSLRAPNLAELKNHSGEKTGGIFGFLRSLNYEMKEYCGYFPIVCWDEGLSDRRIKIDENYKKYKEKHNKSNSAIISESVDDEYVKEYRRQRNKLIILLSYMGIPSIKLLGVEGDDIIKTVVDMSEESVVVSDDSDMLQLLSDQCKIRRPKAKDIWDIDSFLTQNSLIDTRQFVEIKALTGDNSDNIPTSIKGVGDVLAKDFVKVIHEFRSGSEYNFENYPNDEVGMRELCDRVGIRYKKAYLNLDIKRFKINLELVDLSLVHFTEDKIDSIVSTVCVTKSNTNYFNAVKGMSELEIKEDTVSVDNIINWVNISRHNLWGDDNVQ